VSAEPKRLPCSLVFGTKHVLPGWGCCSCRGYNGAHRATCRACGHAYCGPGYRVTKRMKGLTMYGDEVDAIVEIGLKLGGQPTSAAPGKDFEEWFVQHGHEPWVACPMIYDDNSDTVLSDYGECSMSREQIALAAWRAATAAERARCAKVVRGYGGDEPSDWSQMIAAAIEQPEE
jgi:hypothetical protein